MKNNLLERFYSEKPGSSWILIWRLRDKQSFYFSDVNDAIKFARSHEPADLFFQVGLSGGGHGHHRRCSTNERDGRPVVALPALFADVDIESGVHKRNGRASESMEWQ